MSGEFLKRHRDVTNMLKSVPNFLGASVLLSIALNASAEDRCASKNDDWTCFSTITIRPDAGESTLRMVVYPAQELLVEMDQAGTTKRYLTLPTGIELYSGLSADESTFPGGKNPFAFLDLAIGVPVTALRTAFPLGPSSVGDGESKKDIVMEGKPISITAIRRGQQISYRLESASIHATGTWERMAQNPLPGSYPLVGWTSSTKAQFATLEEARSAKTPH
jgi:hypothetical protein